jgi:hypothetical protein
MKTWNGGKGRMLHVALACDEARNAEVACVTGSGADQFPRVAHATKFRFSKYIVISTLILGSMPMTLHAQDGSDATHFWGTSSNSSTSPVASSLMHVNNGLAAGQVNAALDGFLYEGSSISVLSIGSQTVVSTTVIGDDNDVDIDADQNAENSGDVSNDGTVEVVTNEGGN